MEMKKVVFTAVLALSCSAFADAVKQSWFNHTPDDGTFDTELDADPETVLCPGAPASGVAVYRIIATISDLKVFAALPTTAPVQVESKTAKASICAYDGQWYGRSGSTWVALTGIEATPQDGHNYTIAIEYYPNTSPNTSKVKYVVGDESSQELDPPTGFDTAAPSIAAFAGTGAYTSVVCEYEVTIPVGSSGVEVEGGKIIIDTNTLDNLYDQYKKDGESASTASDKAQALAKNDLAIWVNHVLGITQPTADKKPFAAPVQNDDSGKLTFNLGGVNVLGETTTGAKVTYTVVESDSTDFAKSTEGSYVGPKGTVDVTLDGNKVKYYRIKIKIDPAQ